MEAPKPFLNIKRKDKGIVGLISLLALLVSCKNETSLTEPNLSEQVAIGFGGSLESVVEEQTRAVGLEETATSFHVWAYKTLAGDAIQTVIDNYQVNFVTNTAGTTASNSNDWEYAGYYNQGIKYWDFSATAYRFWAHTGNNTSAITASTDGATLTFHNLSLSTTPPVTPLFSSLNKVEPGDFGKTVLMEFLHPYAEVRVMFFCGEVLDGPVTLSDIRFAPTEGKITAKGTFIVNYSTTADRESYSVTPAQGVEGARDYLSFLNVTLDDRNMSSATAVQAGVQATPASSYYYVLPVTSPAKAFTMSAIVGEEPKTATVPAAYMQWQPNYRYTYIFKIGEVAQNLQFYDVQIDPWTYGGKQEETFTKW